MNYPPPPPEKKSTQTFATEVKKALREMLFTNVFDESLKERAEADDMMMKMKENGESSDSDV